MTELTDPPELDTPLDNYERVLGKITGAELGFEDHGIFGLNVDFDFGGSHQGTGWYFLESNLFFGNGNSFIKAIMQAVGVERWHDLIGKTVYVLKDPNDSYGPIAGIEKLPTERAGGTLVFKPWFAELTRLAEASKAAIVAETVKAATGE